MAGGILQTYLILMAIVSMSQPSAKTGVCPGDDRAVTQKMKERQVTLGQHQLQLEKEIAELEGRQESLAWPLWGLESKKQWHTHTVFGLLVPALLVIWRQRRNGARAGERREEETEPGFLGKVCKGVAFLKKPFLLLRAICIFMGTTVACLPCVVDVLVEIALKVLCSRKKRLGLEIPYVP